ncbi:MAG: hypothetical protein JST16_07115 [Bdellovibrionales bacterium]|nr:hypothetical protein [Bdellovibrionales bacterium]
MARFLFTAMGETGHVHPMLPAALALRARGHEVAFLTAERFRPMLEDLGFIFLAPHFWSARYPTGSMPNKGDGVFRNARRAMNYLEEHLFPNAENHARDLALCRSLWPFDVLVASDLALGPSLYAQQSGCVWATVGAFLSCPIAGPDIPLWGPGFRKAKNFWQRIYTASLSYVYKFFFRVVAKKYARFCTRLGLPEEQASSIRRAVSPFLYLVPSTREFDYSRNDLPAQVHYVGPCLWDQAVGDEVWDSPFSNGQPLIYCTAGTFYNGLDFVRVAIEAVRDRPVNLLATIGKNNSVESLGALPPNVRVEQYVPQSLVLPKVDLVLCNGGSGATMAAVLAGKPLAIVPMISDQPENARRWEYLGVAKILSRKRYSPGAAWRLIESVLGDPSATVRAREVGARFAKFDGPQTAARLLETLAAAHLSPSPLSLNRELLSSHYGPDSSR